MEDPSFTDFSFKVTANPALFDGGAHVFAMEWGGTDVSNVLTSTTRSSRRAPTSRRDRRRLAPDR